MPFNKIYLILKFDDIYLLLPQNDVELVETTTNIQFANHNNHMIGDFVRYGLEVMAFNLNKDLLIRNSNPCKFIVLFKDKLVALLCEEVQNITLKDNEIQQLSPVMKLSKSPITHLVIYKDQIAYLCNGKSLVKYLLEL
jgi:chemotaxis signal transduction protein